MSNPLIIITQLADSQITYNQAITIPYEFEAYEFTGTGPSLTIDLVNVPFINHIGSVALTLLNIISEYRIIAIFCILMLAVAVLFWIWRLVTDTPSTVSLNLWGGADVAAEMYEARLDAFESNDDYSNLASIKRGRQNVDTFRRVSSVVKRGQKRFR